MPLFTEYNLNDEEGPEYKSNIVDWRTHESAAYYTMNPGAQIPARCLNLSAEGIADARASHEWIIQQFNREYTK